MLLFQTSRSDLLRYSQASCGTSFEQSESGALKTLRFKVRPLSKQPPAGLTMTVIAFFAVLLCQEVAAADCSISYVQDTSINTDCDGFELTADLSYDITINSNVTIEENIDGFPIDLSGYNFSGVLTVNGTLTSLEQGGIGLQANTVNSIINNGALSAASLALDLNGSPTLTSFKNTGTITSSNSADQLDGTINLVGATVTSFINSGTIKNTQAGINTFTLNGSNITTFNNSGSITSKLAGFWVADSSTINSLNNSGSISTSSSSGSNSYGLIQSNNSILGTFDNSGTVSVTTENNISGYGLYLQNSVHALINSDAISTTTAGGRGRAIYIKSPADIVSITNTTTGTIKVDSNNNFYSHGVDQVSGNIDSLNNQGTIRVTNADDARAIYLQGSVGTITNSGALISESSNEAAWSIYVKGTVSSITNTASSEVISASDDFSQSIYVGNGNANTKVTSVTNAGAITATSSGISRGITALSNGAGISTIVNSGTITANGTTEAKGIAWWSGGNSLTNSGTITASATTGEGIGAIINNFVATSVSNSGTITGSHVGLYIGASGGVTHLTNTGKIYGVSDASIFNAGAITTFSNSQNDLVFRGKLPSNYNIIINSSGDIAKVNFSSPSGAMTLGITANSSITGEQTFSGALNGLSSVNLTSTFGTFTDAAGDTYDWTLHNSSANLWDLFISACTNCEVAPIPVPINNLPLLWLLQGLLVCGLARGKLN